LKYLFFGEVFDEMNVIVRRGDRCGKRGLDNGKTVELQLRSQ
jgi:hypothetical protein